MFNKTKDHNPNYLASIVKLSDVSKHPNADKLQCVSIFANNIITGLDAKDGDLYVYFPLECAISREFLSYTNSFEDTILNKDTLKKGFFNKHGRVRAINLRGSKSEGYIVPVSVLEDFSNNFLKQKLSINESHVGIDFDEVYGHQICKKYVVRISREQGTSKKTKGNVKKYESRLVEDQFRFHYDTEQLKRNMHKISPNDFIAITNKVHGTSFVVSHVLTKKRLGIMAKIAKKIGVSVVDKEYGMLYSSRCVIKNQNFLDPKDTGGFYGEDVWKLTAEKIFPEMEQGISVYGEIVGFTPSGKYIQKDYDYGCKSGEFDIYIYRVTYTSPNGNVYEFSHNQVKQWCLKRNLKMVEEYYYGKAKDLYPSLNTDEHWHENYLNNLIRDYLEKDCHICKNNVPDEGIVLRKDNIHDFEAFKLKSFRFLKKETEELDKGTVDMETEQTVSETTEEDGI